MRADARPEDAFDGSCWVCGEHGRFQRERIAITETFRCPACIAPLRYQGQARALARRFSQHGARSLAQLIQEPAFRQVTVFEPGFQGPLRRHLRRVDTYFRSFYDPESAPGEMRDGARHEDLMQLSFADESVDLVVTSDIFEHIRHPYRAFAEVHRVLRPGGAHIFTVPGTWPMRVSTQQRVDVSGPDDVLSTEPEYHGSSIVYNTFGRDLLDRLDDIGFSTEPILFASTCETTSKQVTFCSVRPRAPVDEVRPVSPSGGS